MKSNSSVTRLVGLMEFVLMKTRNESRKDRTDEKKMRPEWLDSSQSRSFTKERQTGEKMMKKVYGVAVVLRRRAVQMCEYHRFKPDFCSPAPRVAFYDVQQMRAVQLSNS